MYEGLNSEEIDGKSTQET